MSKYIHLRLDKKLQFTVAYVYDDKEIKIGIAKCSPKDTFKKAEGRKIADERLINNPIVLSYNKYYGVFGAIDSFIEDFAGITTVLNHYRKFNYETVVSYINTKTPYERLLAEEKAGTP